MTVLTADSLVEQIGSSKKTDTLVREGNKSNAKNIGNGHQ